MIPLDMTMATLDLMWDIYIYIRCYAVFLMFSRWHTIFTGRELSAQYDAVMWNESCS